MAINGINGARFNPYPVTTGSTRGTAPSTERGTAAEGAGRTPTAPAQDVAAAIKQDAASRAALVASPHAPDGVDQELWSVLTKEERGFFVKAGAMGPLTYGRSTSPQGAPSAPIMRGGRLDIRA